MLGSMADADDALQETLMAAWRGLAGFEQRSSLRAWLYRIATRCCLRLASRRPTRVVSWEHGPARSPVGDLGSPIEEPVFLDPWVGPPDPADTVERSEQLGLAYVAALQHLPANQRAVLILREVLDFSAAEVAEQLDTSVASVNSALQRARRTVGDRFSGVQDLDLVAAQDDETRAAVARFVDAFERRDVPALVGLLAEEVRFTMPPLPAWFDGREDVVGFFSRRVFETPWRALPVDLGWCPGVACYQDRDGSGRFLLSALDVLALRGGEIAWIASFLDPALLARLEVPSEIPAPER
jgi:RNA polymerase sigma-70 factor (ECF subfamily)